MTHLQTPLNPDAALASLPPIGSSANVRPLYDLDVLRGDAQCHVEGAAVSVPADRIGLHVDPAGSAWLTVHHPTFAGQPFTLLGLDDPTGRDAALMVLCRAAVALKDGDSIDRAAAVVEVEHRGAAGGRVLAASMADHLTVVDAYYVTRDGIEVRA